MREGGAAKAKARRNIMRDECLSVRFNGRTIFGSSLPSFARSFSRILSTLNLYPSYPLERIRMLRIFFFFPTLFLESFFFLRFSRNSAFITISTIAVKRGTFIIKIADFGGNSVKRLLITTEVIATAEAGYMCTLQHNCGRKESRIGAEN